MSKEKDKFSNKGEGQNTEPQSMDYPNGLPLQNPILKEVLFKHLLCTRVQTAPCRHFE